MINPRYALVWVWLIFAMVCGAWVAHRFVDGAPLETNLLALLPQTERNSRAETAFGALSDTLGNRAVFLVGNRDSAVAHDAATQFAAALRGASVFRAVMDEAPRTDAGTLFGLYADYRHALLSSSDRRALESAQFNPASRLSLAVHQPFSSRLVTDRAADPFEFMNNWIAALPLLQSQLRIEKNRFTAVAEGLSWVLVVAELPGSAYDDDVQRRVTKAVDSAASPLTASFPGTKILKTGSVFFAAAARESAERDVDFIGALSLTGILLMLWLLFRSIRPLALGMLTVMIGIAVATAATVGIHGNLHLLTLVFGASLIGEAIDYAIQYFAAQLGSDSDWEPYAGLRRVLPGLSMALITSLVGYGALTLAPFPAIAQIALFAFAGLCSAWLSVILILPCLSFRKMSRDAQAATRLPRLVLAFWRERVSARIAAGMVVAVVLCALPGWIVLHADDDIRLLVTRPAQLAEDEARIRAISGTAGMGRFFLVEGDSVEQVLQREEALSAALTNNGEPVRHVAVSQFVPSESRQAENRRLIEQTLLNPPGRVAKLLADADFRDEVARRWIASFRDSEKQGPLTVSKWQSSPISVPYRHLVFDDDRGLAGVVIVQGDAGSADLAAIASAMAGVTLVDKAASVSALLQQYRQSGAKWLPMGVLLIFGIVAIRYGVASGAALLLPTVLGMIVAVALHGYSGTPVTLFGVMGLLLTLGVGVNYSIFLIEGGDRSAASFAGVLLSAATTLLSFGLLAFSSMPALQQFGLMMFAGISVSVLFSPLVLLTETARRVR